MFEGDTEAPPPARLGGCDACRARWDRLAQAVRIARALPANIPSQAHREQIRVELLARAEASWRRPARMPVTKVALAAAAVVTLAAGLAVLRMRATPQPLRSHVTIHGQLAAKYAIATAPPDETVRLHDGAITLDVEPLRPQERFRVLVGDDEVEVRGTSFEVIAAAERLVSVSVTRGHVDVRPHGGSTTSLGPGQSWVAEPIVVTPSPQPASAPDPAPEPERSRAPRRRLARGESVNLPELPA
ncbi:MAG TPA: FecR domain-containing protein, partial [Burkholderiaceae bacterium]|nr:FecR domain-containing protein [Burkholderiaceae bacterium]